MEPQDDIKLLLEKYKAGTITDAEKAVLDKWYLHVTADSTEEMSKEERLETFDEVLAHLEGEVLGKGKVRRLWPRIAAAASVFLVLAAGSYFYFKPNEKQESVLALNEGEEMKPFQKGVTLTLGNGQQMLLNKNAGRTKAADGTVLEEQEGGLQYEANEEVAMHTLSNNTGVKYSLVLNDGTEAFLDAASSITYPTKFVGKERKVAVTGQVYFKVKHDENMPFRVSVKGELIEDIGTEFNINAYDDEVVVRTTLIEGAVKVNELYLKPGEQSIDGKHIKKADIESTTAWLQGKLIFSNEPLEVLMNRVARIYDVQLEWVDPETKSLKFGGSFNRTKKLAVVLNYFRKIGEVDFKVEGQTVKIFKKKIKTN